MEETNKKTKNTSEHDSNKSNRCSKQTGDGIKHSLTESYLQSLTESERLDEMEQWSPSEWQQYYCPNGTMTLEEFRQVLYKRIDEMILEKYGSDYID